MFARANDRKASKGLLTLLVSAVSKTTQYLYTDKRGGPITNPEARSGLAIAAMVKRHTLYDRSQGGMWLIYLRAEVTEPCSKGAASTRS